MTLIERSNVHKVLPVDDDDAVRDMMYETLKRKGFEISTIWKAKRTVFLEEFAI